MTDRHRALSRERIVAAALELIDEGGMAALTMRALGQRLGVEAMALYHYFPSKQALLEAIGEAGRDVESLFGGYFDDATASGMPAGELIVELGMRYIAFSQEHPAQFQLLFNTLPIGTESWEQFVRGTSTFQIPQRAVQAGIESGELRPRVGYGRDEMAYTLWALVHGLAVLRQTRLRNMTGDFDHLDRTLLENLVRSWQS